MRELHYLMIMKRRLAELLGLFRLLIRLFPEARMILFYKRHFYLSFRELVLLKYNFPSEYILFFGEHSMPAYYFDNKFIKLKFARRLS